MYNSEGSLSWELYNCNLLTTTASRKRTNTWGTPPVMDSCLSCSCRYERPGSTSLAPTTLLGMTWKHFESRACRNNKIPETLSLEKVSLQSSTLKAYSNCRSRKLSCMLVFIFYFIQTRFMSNCLDLFFYQIENI